jgi:SAM-dependent methyltransferase
LFDAVAALYDSTRQGYPDEIVEAVVELTALAPGDRVLEVGCGTGQLTVSLAHLDLDLTAIDLGPDMVVLAREAVGGAPVRFEVTAFEDLEAEPGSFRVITSATAFHWVDPDAGWPKAAELLQPDGFLAILGTAEIYADPFGAALRRTWIDHSDDGGAWAASPQPTLSQRLVASGLFGSPVVRSHHQERTMAPEAVFDLEQTRATLLCYSDDVRTSFNDRLRALLRQSGDVPLVQETTLLVLRRADAEAPTGPPQDRR